MSNLLTELACLQCVIGDQLIHRQPTERKVLIYTFMARTYQGRKPSALCEGVQLLYEPSYQTLTQAYQVWSHVYQGMNRKEPTVLNLILRREKIIISILKNTRFSGEDRYKML